MRLSAIALLVPALALTLLATPSAIQEKGGEDETGPYSVVENWPSPWARQGYIWGSQPGIFAESPNRIFIAARGELKLPETLPRGFNGIWGSMNQRATEPKPEMRNCIVVVDGSGRLIEAWTQWDKLFEGGGGPHKIRISPYDPQKHVWVVNDARHQIYEFTNDGKQLVRTLGEADVAGNDDKHFGRPQDIAWLPDGSLLVADGLGNSRVAKFDKNGVFVKAWGTRGSGPGQFSGPHGIATDRSGRVYVADRSNHRIQIFDGDGRFLDQWPGLRQANDIVIDKDQHVWVADGTNAKVLEYDQTGKLLYSWGTYGTFPGGFWELHQMSIDSDGNLYGADSFGGRVQKFVPRPGADRSKLIITDAVTRPTSSQAQAPASAAADLVLRNGKIVTVDEARPEAQAMAVRGDTILALGSDQEIQRYVGPSTKVIDLRGALATPGFIDAHVHFTGVGEAARNLKLSTAKNWDDIVRMVAEAAKTARPGEWILGRGWHQEKWSEVPSPNVEGFPLHDALSKAAPNNPVWLTHASGHAGFANAMAMKAAEVTKSTPDPAGGKILKDANGNPTGLFNERAQSLVGDALARDRATRTPAQVEADLRQVIELAARESLSKGLTTVSDAGSPPSTIEVMKRVVDEGKLPLRVWMMLREDARKLAEDMPKYRVVNYGDKRFTVRATKRQIDGALGSRGAWMLEPYSDLPSTSGMLTDSLDDIRLAAEDAIKFDYQMAIHAIGDRGNREVLNIYEETFKRHPEKNGKALRWRVEHAQHISAPDIPRFGALGVIASMEGIHCTSDALYVLARLGPKRAEEGAYVWQKLMKSGALIANGTDAPVEDVDPIPSFYASVSRRARDGSVFFPDQRMSRMEALKSYTINAAYADFDEDIKGSLRPGKLADVTVFSKDLLTVPEDQIPTAQVLYTIVGGKVQYSRTPN